MLAVQGVGRLATFRQPDSQLIIGPLKPVHVIQDDKPLKPGALNKDSCEIDPLFKIHIINIENNTRLTVKIFACHPTESGYYIR